MTMISSSLAVVLALTCSLSAAFAPQSTSRSFMGSALQMATWSDARAVREYQAFLATGQQDIVKTPDGPCVIVKSAVDNELADAIVQMGMGDDVVLTPGQEAPPQIGGATAYPIYITVLPGELREFLKNLPASFQERRDDFVFISGGLKYGNIEKILKDTGYCRDEMTQFLATGFKTQPVIQDISTSLGPSESGEEKFAGECFACGKWSGSVEQRLEKNAIRCKTVFYREWRRMMYERNVYDAVFNLVGAVRNEPTTLQDVSLYYGDEVSDIVWEISGILRGGKAITLTYGFEERMFGIGEATGAESPQCQVNAEMYDYLFMELELAATLNEYLGYAQDEMGLLQGVEFIRRKPNSKPILLQGNLRADGVL